MEKKIKQIKNKLGIDILLNARRVEYLYFRYLIVQDMIKEEKTYNEIADVIKRDRSTIYNIVKIKPELDPLFEFIKKAYDTMEKKYFLEFLKNRDLTLRKNINKRSNSFYHANNPKKEPEINIEDITKPPILEVAYNLRRINTNIAHKPYNKWEVNDFKQYEKLTGQKVL